MKTRFGLICIVALCVVLSSSPLAAVDFLFYWDPSPDRSVIAYGIHQRSGDAPYENISSVRVADLDDPIRPSYRVTGLTDGSTFWFAATAISASGTESDYFNEVCITVNGRSVECPDEDDDEDDDGTAVYASCFIASAWKGSRY